MHASMGISGEQLLFLNGPASVTATFEPNIAKYGDVGMLYKLKVGDQTIITRYAWRNESSDWDAGCTKIEEELRGMTASVVERTITITFPPFLYTWLKNRAVQRNLSVATTIISLLTKVYSNKDVEHGL